MRNLPSTRSINQLLSRELPKYFTREEIHRILDQAKDSPRDHLFLNLLWHTGARISELLQVRVSDIDPYLKTIQLLTLKTKKRPVRVVPLQSEILKEIFDYIEAFPPGGDRIFPFSRQNAHLIVRTYCQRANIDSVRSHPHTFRHSFAINAILQKRPLPVVQVWLGHQSFSSTLIYTKVLASDTLGMIDGMEF